jgi:hypothetical protein
MELGEKNCVVRLDQNDFSLRMRDYFGLVGAQMARVANEDTRINVKIFVGDDGDEKFATIDRVKLDHHGRVDLVVLRVEESDETNWYIVDVLDAPNHARVEQFVLFTKATDATLEFGATEGYRAA